MARRPIENAIVAGDALRSSRACGDGYLTELRRVLLQHVQPVTRTYLEWGAGDTTLAILQMRDVLAVDDFFSIDHNQACLDQLIAQLPPWSGFHPICCDLMGPKFSDRDPELNDATWPLGLKRRFDWNLRSR